VPEVCTGVIAYCTNIHPGETWEEIFLSLKTHAIAVKNTLAFHEPFPLGLRLSRKAARNIDRDASERFLGWLEEKNCFVPTINGFPYGSFHIQDIKDKVYLPDWRSDQRVEYSKELVGLLGAWLPEGVAGSVSTVPVGFKGHVEREDFPLVRKNLIAVLEHIDRIKQQTGKDIVLSLEPEPGCILETGEEVVSFFEAMRFPEAFRPSIGVCFDFCHQAVEFETPSSFLNLLAGANIRIGKVQVSAGLSFQASEVKTLTGFDEPCYLHQVVIKDVDGALVRYKDIPEALDGHPIRGGEEWRVHFHVPIYADRTASCGTTRSFIEETLPLLRDHNLLLEIETYTWQVLPEEMRPCSVNESIVREVEWLRSRVSQELGSR
jgi:hypothetical protein